jgi:anthranilate synthase/aminodeoxychorismate synthase-like glutamine amidotransferase
MILIIDNYDSFTYNLVQEIGQMGAEVAVYRNDAITVGAIQSLAPSHIVISPGPGVPADAGISIAVIQQIDAIPILGVCLGHQAIAEAFGGEVILAPTLMHGKTSQISHWGDPLFADVDAQFRAARYHSLVMRPDLIPPELAVIALADTGEIMGLRHATRPVVGVQFHPESVMTPDGPTIIGNFIRNRFLVEVPIHAQIP